MRKELPPEHNSEYDSEAAKEVMRFLSHNGLGVGTTIHINGCALDTEYIRRVIRELRKAKAQLQTERADV